MKKVVFISPALTQSGYGVHARQIARWLLGKKDIDVKFINLPWGDTPWILNHNSYDGLIGELIRRSTSKELATGADVAIHLQLPNEWDPTIGKINIGVTAGVETTIANPRWVEHCNKMSMVIVPSKHTLDCLKASGEIKVPCFVIPEAFPDAVLTDPPPPELDLPAENNFLIVSQLTSQNPYTDRKNILLTIKWICEEFQGRQDVGIVLKTNGGRSTKIDKRIVTNILTHALAEVRKSAFPKIHLVHGSMDDSEVAGLYRHPKIKALVSLTRGEGFGLPILEAAASGLPVIATNWSGHLDFMNLGKFIPISYSLQQIPAERVDGQIFVPGAKWAQPSEQDFKRRIKKFLESPAAPNEWALSLKQKIRESYSQNNISSLFDQVLGEVVG